MNELKTEVTSFDDILRIQQELQTIISEKGQGLLKNLFKEFFDNNPEIKAISWTQYTPYFNDGDVCEFRVHDIYGANTDDPEEIEDLHYGDISGEYKCFCTWGKEKHAALAALSNTLDSSAGEAVLKAAFGDHAKITVTRHGIEVESYDHD